MLIYQRVEYRFSMVHQESLLEYPYLGYLMVKYSRHRWSSLVTCAYTSVPISGGSPIPPVGLVHGKSCKIPSMGGKAIVRYIKKSPSTYSVILGTDQRFLCFFWFNARNVTRRPTYPEFLFGYGIWVACSIQKTSHLRVSPFALWKPPPVFPYFPPTAVCRTPGSTGKVHSSVLIPPWLRKPP